MSFIQRFSSTYASLRLPRPGALVRAFNRPTAQPDPSIGAVAAGEYGLRLDAPPRPMAATRPGAGQHELWLLETPQGRKVLKRYKDFLKEGQIAFEHAILLHLAEQGFPTVRLLIHPGGGTYTQVDGRYYAVFDYLEEHFRFDSYIFIPARSAWYGGEMGRVLARLHAALRGFSPGARGDYGFQSSGDRADSLAWYLETLRQTHEAALAPGGEANPVGTANPSGAAPRQPDPANLLLLPLAGRIHERLEELDERLSEAALPRQIIHGDYGPYNLLVRPGGGLAVLDFELARFDWRLVDLISAFSTTTTRARPSAYLSIMCPILEGYRSVNPIPREELRLLPLIWQYLILRRIILCWKWRLRSGEKKWLDEIHRRLRRLAWVEQHEGDLL